jgi:bifunctional non-homologous end joining protein LigD
MATEYEVFEFEGLEVKLSNPGKVYFPQAGVTKGELARYYVEAAAAVLNHLRERPTVLKRYAGGIEAEPFYQKRVPPKRPAWIQTAVLQFPSGRSAEELVPVDAAHLVWGVSLGNVDWNPHPVRRADLDHPDELRVDLDPMPGAPWERVRRVAMIAKAVLEENGLRGYPRTSGSRGMHIPVRIHQRWDFTTVRRAALALAREVERRAEGEATSKWWKEERPPETVFVDYNQNAKDHTVASGYSVRPVADARVATHLAWEEVPECDPAAWTIRTVPERLRTVGDPSADIDEHAGSLDSLLAMAAADEEERGLEDAPWPPHFAKQPGEPKRVQPSRDTDRREGP